MCKGKRECHGIVREWMGKREMRQSRRLGAGISCTAGVPSPGCTFESPGELYKLMHAHTPPCEIQNELLWGKAVRNLPTMWKTKVRSLGWEGTLEKGTATHSSILAWELQSMRLQRIGHD